MKLNYQKTKFIVFNPCRTKDFLPKFTMDGHDLEAVDEIRLLGIILQSDMRWIYNTENIVC